MKKSILVLSALFLCVVGFAWEFEPQTVTEAELFIPEIEDGDGRACSLLYIQTDIENLTVDSGILGLCRPLEKTEDGYRVYLRRNTRKLSLEAPLFKTARWNLNVRIYQPKAYKGVLLRAGQDPLLFETGRDPVRLVAEPDSFNVTALLDKEDDSPRICVNTDLPFPVLETYFLISGTYQLEGENLQAPYYLRVAEGKKADEVLWLKRFQVDNASLEFLQSPLSAKQVLNVNLTW